MALQSILDLFE